MEDATRSLYEEHKHKETLGDFASILRQELGTDRLTPRDSVSGSVNDGMAFDTDTRTIFVKFNSVSEDGSLFQGEYTGLQALWDTHTLTVPDPIKCIKCAGGAMLVLSHMDLRPISPPRFSELGRQVAHLHLHNAKQKNLAAKQEQSITTRGKEAKYISQFGFPVTTHCGYTAQNNNWMDSWQDFFARKINDYVNIVEEKYNDRQARPLFNQVVRVLPRLFEGLEVEPSLLHGDLWRGNIAETAEGPVAFDPISLYGHSEFELSIAHCHRGFDPSYFTAYHAVLPQAKGFHDRLDLYLLHHYFQLWNHFGPEFNPASLHEIEPDVHRERFGQGYAVSTLQQMKKVAQKFQ